MRASRAVRAAVDTALVKKLRAETKGGVMACRDALEAAGGDFEKARAVVLGTLKSRAGRVMGEGLVAVWAEGDRVAAVEVACETDFVARGPSIARLAAACAAAAGSEGEATEDEAQLLVRVRSAVAAELTEAARATSERIELRRAWRARHRGRVASYVHAPAGQARVASVAVLKDTGKEKSETEEAEAQRAAGRLAVHVAGMTPGGAAELLEQPFAALGSGSGVVGAELKKRGLELLEFVRLEVGEGVQVAQEDYQAAVNAAMRA